MHNTRIMEVAGLGGIQLYPMLSYVINITGAFPAMCYVFHIALTV